MQDTEDNDPEVETLWMQYFTVVDETYASPVQKFGNYTFINEPIADFQGSHDQEASTTSSITDKIVSKLRSAYNQVFDEKSGAPVDKSAISSRDVDL